MTPSNQKLQLCVRGTKADLDRSCTDLSHAAYEDRQRKVSSECKGVDKEVSASPSFASDYLTEIIRYAS